MLPLCMVNASAVNTAAGWSGDSSRSCVIDDVGVYKDYGYALDKLNEEIKEYSERISSRVPTTV